MPSLLWYNLFYLSLGLVSVYTSMKINPSIEQGAIVGLGMALLDSRHIHSLYFSLYRFVSLCPMVDVDLSTYIMHVYTYIEYNDMEMWASQK